MLILKGKESNGIVGKYDSINDARRIYSDAQKYLVQNQTDHELVLVDGRHIVMTCKLGIYKNKNLQKCSISLK